MMHIIVYNGVVTDVVVLGKTPDDRPDVLKAEFDYKVEYYPLVVKDVEVPF